MRLKGQRSRSLEILHNELANRQVNERLGDCVNIAEYCRIAFFDFDGLFLDSHSRWLSFFIILKSVSVRALDKYDCPSDTELTLIRCIISSDSDRTRCCCGFRSAAISSTESYGRPWRYDHTAQKSSAATAASNSLCRACHSPRDAVSAAAGSQRMTSLTEMIKDVWSAGRSIAVSLSRHRNAIGAPTACDADLIDLVTDWAIDVGFFGPSRFYTSSVLLHSIGTGWCWSWRSMLLS